MNPMLQTLYQEVILDHGKQPRNFRKLEENCIHQDAYNPLCGDKLVLYLNVKDGRIEDISFEGQGCAISMASASIMTEELKGKTLVEANAIYKQFTENITGHAGESDMGKLSVLSGVKAFPARVKCATLAWHAFEHAAGGETKASVTTE